MTFTPCLLIMADIQRCNKELLVQTSWSLAGPYRISSCQLGQFSIQVKSNRVGGYWFESSGWEVMAVTLVLKFFLLDGWTDVWADG